MESEQRWMKKRWDVGKNRGVSLRARGQCTCRSSLRDTPIIGRAPTAATLLSGSKASDRAPSDYSVDVIASSTRTTASCTYDIAIGHTKPIIPRQRRTKIIVELVKLPRSDSSRDRNYYAARRGGNTCE